ncbi:MAG: hypothetical protein OEY55_02980 [Acidimicrobiia bacterium]|nr:hypothetical protein [Acidimicrobiia bacterium]MDH5420748.1 hypothetical protein [Acidimicrobiia bacterium]MDH5502848.1 hypothetical protein [Acidimicrobiia bacterium]
MVPVDQYLISPLYRIIDEHQAAAAFLVIGALAFWWARKASPGTRRAHLYTAFSQLSPGPRTATAAMAFSAVAHLGLVFGHEPNLLTLGYLATAAVMAYGVRIVMTGGRWRRWSAGLLGGSLAAFAIATVGGTAPDQIAMLTKLAELIGLAAALSPEPGARLARAGTAGIVIVTAALSISSWAGAFSSGGGHHHGEVPPPAVALPYGVDRNPTADEILAAAELHRRVVEALAPYRDPAVAAQAGYKIGDITTLDHHADNPDFKKDGRIMDPAYPETLVYAAGVNGPVLVGAMFQMDELGDTGPAIGGPLTVWHAHDHVCISFTGITGAVSPLGACSLGSVAIPITNEMIHVFVLDGAPDRFGELSDDWIKQAIGF